MKKLLVLLSVVALSFSLTACGESSSSLVKVCKLEVDTSTTYNREGLITSDLKLYYEGDIVLSVKNVEVVKTADTELFNSFKDGYGYYVELFNDLDYYSAELSIKTNELVYKTDVNYEKIDISKLEDKLGSMQDFMNDDGDLSVEKFVAMYTLMGYTCE